MSVEYCKRCKMFHPDAHICEADALQGCGDCDPCIGGRPDQCAVGGIIVTICCPKCGDVSCNGATGGECPTVRPMLSDAEFIARLVEAGWTQAEAEQELQSIAEDEESGECGDAWHDNPTDQPGWKCPTCKR